MTSAGRQTGHRGADEIRQPIGVRRMALGDEAANHVLRGHMVDTGRILSVHFVTAGSLQHHAAGRRRICIGARSDVQHFCQALGHWPVGAQDLLQRDGARLSVPVEDAAVERGLAAESRIKARRIDAQSLGQIREAEGVVALRMEQLLRWR